MPCYDDRSDYDSSKQKLSASEYEVYIRRAEKAEAMLCALMTEISNSEYGETIIATASRHGLIDLMQFWHEHQADDRSRLAKDLHKFSKHEQKILLELLKEQSDKEK